MSAKPIARLCDCKGTEKNVYVQEKFTFFCHRLHFFSVASRIKVPSKVLYFFHSCKYIHKKSPFMSENINGGKGMKVE